MRQNASKRVKNDFIILPFTHLVHFCKHKIDDISVLK